MKSLLGKVASMSRKAWYAVKGLEERIEGLSLSRRKRPPGVRYARLGLQSLEGRLVPANYFWTGAAVNDASVHTAQNWIDETGTLMAVPGANDTATFDGLHGPDSSKLAVVNNAWAVDQLMMQNTLGLTLNANLNVSDLFRQIATTTTANAGTTLTAKRFETNSATIAGAGTLAVGAGGGSFTASAAYSNIAVATTTLAAGSTSSIATSVDFTGANVTNSGTVNWTVGAIGLGANTLFTNTAAGTFDAQCDNLLRQAVAGNGRLLNNGTFSKSVTVGATTVSVLFDNQGAAAQVWAKKGTIELGNNGTHSSPFKADFQAAIAFLAGAVNLNQGTTFTGNGAIGIAGANVTVPVNVTIVFPMPLSFLGGNITVNGVMQSQTSLTWGGGTMTGGQFDAYGTVLITGAADKARAAGTFNNYAVATYEGTGVLELGLGAVWNNHTTFEIRNTAAIARGVGAASTFNNLITGTVAKAAGAGVGSAFAVNFANAGLLTLNGFQIKFDGALGSVFTQSATGVTDLGGGTIAVVGGAAFTLNGGYLEGGGTIDGNLVNHAGTVVVGDSLLSEVLSVTGNYTQRAGAKLRVGISTGPVFGLLAVTGTANIAGNVEVYSVDGTVPAPTTKRDILTAGTLNGTFGPNPPGYTLDYPVNQNKVVLIKT